MIQITCPALKQQDDAIKNVVLLVLWMLKNRVEIDDDGYFGTEFKKIIEDLKLADKHKSKLEG